MLTRSLRILFICQLKLLHFAQIVKVENSHGWGCVHHLPEARGQSDTNMVDLEASHLIASKRKCKALAHRPMPAPA